MKLAGSPLSFNSGGIKKGGLIFDQVKEELRKVDLNDIQVVAQVRKQFDSETIMQLAQSIEKIGLQQPILVCKLPEPIDGKHYRLINGERRFRAYSSLNAIHANDEENKFKSILAVVALSIPDEGMRIFQQLTENLQREDLHPVQVSEQIANLLRLDNVMADKVRKSCGMKETGSTFTSTEIANLLGKSKQWVSTFKAPSELPDELRTAMIEAGVGNVNVYTFTLSIHKGVDDPNITEKLINFFESFPEDYEGNFLSEIRELRARLLNKPMVKKDDESSQSVKDTLDKIPSESTSQEKKLESEPQNIPPVKNEEKVSVVPKFDQSEIPENCLIRTDPAEVFFSFFYEDTYPRIVRLCLNIVSKSADKVVVEDMGEDTSFGKASELPESKRVRFYEVNAKDLMFRGTK